MAKKKKKPEEPPVIGELRAMFYSPAVPPETKLMMGVAGFLGAMFTMRFAPRHASKVIPAILSVFEPQQPVHPEGREAIETRIDEHQIGRSEVIRALTKELRN